MSSCVEFFGVAVSDTCVHVSRSKPINITEGTPHHLAYKSQEQGEKTALTIFHSGSMAIATFRKSLSKNGTRASKPHADVDLLALKQSYK